MELQIVTWAIQDTPIFSDYGPTTVRCVIHIFGRRVSGESVCVTVPFQPDLFFPGNQSTIQQRFDNIRWKMLAELVPDADARKVFYPPNGAPPTKEPFLSDNNYDIGISSWQTVRKKKLIGYRENKTEFQYLKFESLQTKKLFEKFHRYSGLPTLFESNVDPILKFMHETNVQSCGWVRLDEYKPANYSRCDFDIRCERLADFIPLDKNDIAPLRILSFDIECYSESRNFPTPRCDPIVQIGVTLRKGEKQTQHLLCLGKHDPIPDCEHLQFDSEKEMLEQWALFIQKHDPDWLVGYNIYGFDLDYIYKRSKFLECSDNTYDTSRLIDHMCEIEEKNLTTNAYGHNSMKFAPNPGRFIFDLLFQIKRDHNLESYKLDNVASHFLNANKNDVTPLQIFEFYESGDPNKRRIVGEYCLVDTELPLKLIDKLLFVPALIEMAKATWVPINYLVEKGQQIKCFSQIVKKAREKNFCVPSFIKPKDTEGYEGATVLEPQINAYWDPITALDFASLYPSIMVAHNMCYTTLILDNNDYDDLSIDTIPVKQSDGKIINHQFVQDTDCILPEILTELKLLRKEAKRNMAKSTGFMKDVYDKKQLAYKVTMNSLYGFTGTTKGYLPFQEIASSVTAKGREMIELTKQNIETWYPGSTVIYGDTDSVMIKFKTNTDNDQDAIEKSWIMGEEAAQRCTEQFKKPNELELEKVYSPYILLSKKRYAALLYDGKRVDGKMVPSYIDKKGIQAVRRDTIPFVRNTMNEILNKLLYDRDVTGAKLIVDDKIKSLMGMKISLDQLVVSKTLSKKYERDSDFEKQLQREKDKNTLDPHPTGWYKSVNLPHITVVKKIKERSPGYEPKVGERVPYVFIQTPSKNQYEKAEDPAWVEQNNIPIDYEYYVEHQLQEPILNLFKSLMENPTDLFKIITDKKQAIKDEIKARKKRLKEEELEELTAYKNVWGIRGVGQTELRKQKSIYASMK